MSTASYQGTSYALPNGILLSSIGPVPVGTGLGQNAGQHNGLILQYNQTKTEHTNQDGVLVLYLGRPKPAVETSGGVQFETFDLAYAWPPSAVGIGDASGYAVYTLVQNILVNQRSGYLVQIQTSQGHGAAYNGITYPALYGYLQDDTFDYVPGQVGWIAFRASFTEVG